MATADNLVGYWKPASDGERLLHSLARNVGEFRALDHLHHDVISRVMRGRQFMRFAEGVILLHCFGRLFQAARWYREQWIDDPTRAVKSIEQFATETLG